LSRPFIRMSFGDEKLLIPDTHHIGNHNSQSFKDYLVRL
jgi:hypothetical protein